MSCAQLRFCATVLQHILATCPALTLSRLQLVCADVSQVQLCLLPDLKQLLTLWQAGAPLCKQRHSNPWNLAAKFNNLKHFPNAIVEAEGQHIHVHTFIIGNTSEALAKCWSNDIWHNADGIISLSHDCPGLGDITYPIALTFLEFFYTGQVRWPDGTPDVTTAAQILVLAYKFDVPYLVCEAEMALQSLVTVDCCCPMLVLVDKHNAVRLQHHLLEYIVAGSAHMDTSQLPPHLLTYVIPIECAPW